MSHKEYGSDGEREVVSLVPCPNCHHVLMVLPESYPLVDVQCSACNFRAQVKTSSTNPYKLHIIRGGGWDIMEKVIKAGFLIPPIITNHKWTEKEIQKQEIRFYPFLMKSNLKKRVANIHKGKRVYKMFDYNLTNTPYFVLLQK